MDQTTKNTATSYNYFQCLPTEIQDYLGQFLPKPKNQEACLKKKLDQQRCQGEELRPLETKQWKIYFDWHTSDLFLHDKQNNKNECIIKLSESGIKKFLSLFFKKEDYSVENNMFMQTRKSITPFAVSPDQTKLAAIQQISYLECGNSQSGIWFVDLKTKKNAFKRLPELFANRLIQIHENDTRIKQEYLNTGYDFQGLYPEYAKKLFNHIAIANDGTIALMDSDTIYYIDPITNQHIIKFQYKNKIRPEIYAITFSPNGTLGINQYYNSRRETQLIFSKKTTIDEKNQNYLANYFFNKTVCKPEQLAN